MEATFFRTLGCKCNPVTQTTVREKSNLLSHRTEKYKILKRKKKSTRCFLENVTGACFPLCQLHSVSSLSPCGGKNGHHLLLVYSLQFNNPRGKSKTFFQQNISSKSPGTDSHSCSLSCAGVWANLCAQNDAYSDRPSLSQDLTSASEAHSGRDQNYFKCID